MRKSEVTYKLSKRFGAVRDEDLDKVLFSCMDENEIVVFGRGFIYYPNGRDYYKILAYIEYTQAFFTLPVELQEVINSLSLFIGHFPKEITIWKEDK